NIYVLNRGNGSTGSIMEFDSFGDYLDTLATGLVNANGMVLDGANNLYFTCNNNVVKRIAADGTMSTVTNIAGATTLQGITVMTRGFLAVADSGNSNGGGVWTVNPISGIYSNLTGFNGVGSHFGPRTFSKFNGPVGISAAANNFLVVADKGNNRV